MEKIRKREHFLLHKITWIFHWSINHSQCINYILSDRLTFAVKGVNVILLLHNENNMRKYMQECLFNFLLSAFFLCKIMNCCLSPMKRILLGLDFKIWTDLCLLQDKTNYIGIKWGNQICIFHYSVSGVKTTA